MQEITRVPGQEVNACVYISLKALAVLLRTTPSTTTEDIRRIFNDIITDATDLFLKDTAQISANHDERKGGAFVKDVMRRHFSSQLVFDQNAVTLVNEKQGLSNATFIQELKDRLNPTDFSNSAEETIWLTYSAEAFFEFFRVNGLMFKHDKNVKDLANELKRSNPNAELIRKSYFDARAEKPEDSLDKQILAKVINPMYGYPGAIGYTLQIQGHVICIAKGGDNKFYAFDSQTGILQRCDAREHLLSWIYLRITDNDYEIPMYKITLSPALTNRLSFYQQPKTFDGGAREEDPLMPRTKPSRVARDESICCSCSLL